VTYNLLASGTKDTWLAVFPVITFEDTLLLANSNLTKSFEERLAAYKYFPSGDNASPCVPSPTLIVLLFSFYNIHDRHSSI
jgi:hypothetical protein